MRKYALNIFLLDTFFFLLALTFMVWLKPGSFVSVVTRFWPFFAGFILLWFSFSLISGKYLDSKNKSLSQLYIRLILSDIPPVAIIFVMALILGQPRGLKIMLLGTAGITFALEVLHMSFGYFNNKYFEQTGKRGISMRPVLYPDLRDVNEDMSNWFRRSGNGHCKSNKTFREELVYKDFSLVKNISKSSVPLLEKILESSNIELHKVVSDSVPLQNIRAKNTQILNTRTLFNIQVFDPESLQLFINLHRLNDIRRISEFLIQVNKNLQAGGYFVGCALTVEERKKKFFTKHKKPFGWILYTMDFLILRAAPKLPYLRVAYFAVTKGQGRSISRAEVKGRLIYCGFTPVETAYFQNYMYFIARKTHKPSSDMSPTYGPFIKMRRVAKNGDLINIYKLRTMHPYSEYVQDYLYQKHKLDDSGKIRDDYRVTTWGKVLRKLWIDELPQLVNFYRGQVKLVGVRAISPHYFSLYPEELQQLRTQTKPGLVPPYYKDNPKSFEEICDSEKKYLERYFKHPFLTDWKYFWAAFYNIVFKKARSK